MVGSATLVQSVPYILTDITPPPRYITQSLFFCQGYTGHTVRSALFFEDLAEKLLIYASIWKAFVNKHRNDTPENPQNIEEQAQNVYM